MENVRNDSNMNRRVAVRRAAKRSLPWGLEAGQLNLMSPQQAEDTQATQRPRLETPFPASTDEATAKNTKHDTVALPHPDADHADSDPVMDVNPNAKANEAPRRWTPEEDVELTSALANTCKKKWGKKYMTDWVALATLVSGRTK
jgi:hypothetical protein